MTDRVFLDACVLYPRLVRQVLLGLDELGLVTPLWSPRVLEEWRIAAARGGAEAEADAVEAAVALRARHPEGEVEPEPGIAVPDLPDPADAHVLAAAAAGGAAAIVTFNLRDFPARRLAPFGLIARHPDGLLWEALSEEPAAVGSLLDAAIAAAGRTPAEGRGLLKRAGLPRTGKAWAAMRLAPGSRD